ncbi:precorrin-2 C(20)-methyltransferase [Candidatus Viridilinea mediisalina]|uniref:Precorrin-2 C(20)-methyltransferase n=1 Tax=Candidatus Viridilinea mediisalina TaxID=2024553 RepID=A0A2A6RDX7_9CHLR|nr:precorrin-2 C(20)-methyltransferase [Candidatus Viridilinea mediisalina]PDW01021.1 precorrin-2 C(20)-methyltransferase [Candidatus Viridilinea mediisalina]
MPPSIKLTVVGLGPGDPDLITMKGIRALQAAQIIFAPRSQAEGESRALRIAQPWLDPQRQQVVPLRVPMQRDAAQTLAAYGQLATTMGTALDSLAATQPDGCAQGAYLLLGDPLLYGTFTTLRSLLQERYPNLALEIIPGITAFAATAAHVGLPLSIGDERVAILPAPRDAAELRELTARFATLVLMKVGSQLPALLNMLTELDLLEHCVYAEHIGMPEERIVHDVASLHGYAAPYLSLLLVRSNV